MAEPLNLIELNSHLHITASKMAEYKQVKIGKLNLKGISSHKKTKSKKRKHDRPGEKVEVQDEDTIRHGGWWAIKEYGQIRSCNIALQTWKGNYIIARDNGTLVMGELHENNVPEVEEIFTLVKLSETKVAFKSGYGNSFIFLLSHVLLNHDIYSFVHTIQYGTEIISVSQGGGPSISWIGAFVLSPRLLLVTRIEMKKNRCIEETT